ncbi:CRISPR-associated helicase Cas3' [Cyanobacterium aponinum AL20118]|uniref:CRISPR-associated helicase Cas3 n=1 Tax=Cyanobacterium aponinum AL20115 TaxID=3090662 RepID=A0AAF0ZEU1_9CHRO|nr:CRISPR-associated helicase Cas3' [Cyanobacterium aponinum]WPF87557.1 CRISPR-associated helicase Cas3' [Cyanobacterium aponinum AL20115]
MQPKLIPNLLLAKSYERNKQSWKGSYTLVGHTADVINSITTIIDTLGGRLINQFGLKCSLQQLKATAKLAGYIHDWGKANNHFQGVVRQHMKNAEPKRFLPENPQLIRHEVASVLLAWEFKEWLQQGEGDFMTALAAAGGHHLKLGGRIGKCTDELGEIRQAGENKLYLYTIANNQYLPSFKGLIRYGMKELGLPKPKLSQKPSICWTIQDIKVKQNEIITAYESWQYDPVVVAVIKALVISGDAIASAIPQTNFSIKDFITNKSISNTLNESKLQQVIDNRLEGNKLRPFQEALGNTQARVTLARAGCGTGKTLGAYNWAKSQAMGRKLIFCYPTTGTSTEGFIDYVHNQLDSVLLHSRADVDLAQLPQNLYATGEEEEAEDNEIATKLESFKAWGKESIVCTVDTVLGMLQCNRRPLYLFPVIAQSAFVFDEVHCYDDRLFGALLRFLEVVKAPILLMSASFLPWQLEAIQKAVGENLELIQGSKELESYPRYNFHYYPQPDWQRVQTELSNGGKVLWVCNQVNTAIDVYKQAKSGGLNALLYHSRYRYQDRVKHHRAVVDAFKPENKEPVLAIATQVAEMSLDLSATLLVSQIAEPAGLIQRLGRLNRRYCGHALDAIFYPDEKVGFPYSQKQLEEGKKLIKSFSKEVTQAELAQWLESLEDTRKPETDSVLLDGEWRTYPTSLRKEGFNITVLLEQDLAKIKSIPSKELPRYTVPIPARDTHKWQRHKFYPIAPSNLWGYTSELGGFEIKEGKS